MNENYRKTIVYAVFVGALILAYFHFGGRSETEVGTPQNRPPESVLQDATKTPDPTILPDETVHSYQELTWGKDPFYHSYRPPRKEVIPQPVELRLLGILHQQVNAQALINNRVVQLGDTIAGYTVTEITRDYVAVSDGATTRILRVKKEQS